MTDSIQCNLAQNALDYLILAGEQAQLNTPRMLKHSVATLADGIELLLKARLEIHDWRLIFVVPDKADEGKYQNGDFKSVTMDQAVKRLSDSCDITVDDEPLNTLDLIRRLRNKIRHFAVTTNREEVISLIAKAYSFAIDFTTTHLEPTQGDVLEAELNGLRKLLGEFSEFVTARLEEIQDILDDQGYAWHVQCPKCAQETLYPSEEHAKCVFCGYDRDGETAAIDVVEYMHGPFRRVKEQIYIAECIEHCPECGHEACIYVEEHKCWICLSCGESADYHRCNYCFRLYGGERGPGGACDDCWQHILEKND